MLQKLLLVLMLVSLMLAPGVLAQDDDFSTVVVEGLGVTLQYPTRWFSYVDPSTAIFAADPADMNTDFGAPRHGPAVMILTTPLDAVGDLGFQGDMGDPADLLPYLNGEFGFGLTSADFAEVFGVQAVMAKGTVGAFPGMVYVGALGESAFLAIIAAPTPEALQSALPIWEAMQSSATPIELEAAPVIPAEYDHAPDGVTVFSDYASFQAVIDQIRGGDEALLDAMWDQLSTNMALPLRFGPQAVFMFRGRANRVEVRGDFTGWNPHPDFQAERVGDSDLWMVEVTLPLDARAEYKLVLNNTSWIFDAYNPDEHLGGYGHNNVIRMPAFSATSFTTARDDIQRGEYSEELIFESAAMGYDIAYRVYLPVGYDDMDALPVVYVTDGNDWGHLEMGGMTTVLDNLLADGAIQPVIGVFIYATQPGQPDNNRREREFLENPDYATFVAEELVPFIDATYRTDPRAEARIIQGTSFGGVAAFYVALQYPEVFTNIAAFSPAMWAATDTVHRYADAEGLGFDVFMTSGVPGWDVGRLEPLKAILEDGGATVEYVQVNDGHNWGHWGDLTDEMLVHFFGAE